MPIYFSFLPHILNIASLLYPPYTLTLLVSNPTSLSPFHLCNFHGWKGIKKMKGKYLAYKKMTREEKRKGLMVLFIFFSPRIVSPPLSFGFISATAMERKIP